jgi:hypothetical protein
LYFVQVWSVAPPTVTRKLSRMTFVHFSCQFIYKKNILALRGSFRPVTKVNMNMWEIIRCFLTNKVERVARLLYHYEHKDFKYKNCKVVEYFFKLHQSKNGTSYGCLKQPSWYFWWKNTIVTSERNPWSIWKIILPWYESIFVPNVRRKWGYHHFRKSKHPRMKELYKFFKFNGKVVDIDDFDPETLEVFSVKY